LLTSVQISRSSLQSSGNAQRAERLAFQDESLCLHLERLSHRVLGGAHDSLRFARDSWRPAHFDRRRSSKTESASRRFETHARHDLRVPHQIERCSQNFEVRAHHFPELAHFFLATRRRSEPRSR
jgi:hypothetical protein